MKRWMVAVLALALLVGACGDDDGGGADLSAEEQALAVAIADEIGTDIEADEPFADAAARLCFAEGIVGAMGAGRLAELGVSSAGITDEDTMFEQLTEGELNAFYDAATGCIDFEAEFVDGMVADGLSRESAECFAGELDDSFFRDVFLGGVTGGDDFTPSGETLQTMFTAAAACLTPDELEGFFGG